MKYGKLNAVFIYLVVILSCAATHVEEFNRYIPEDSKQLIYVKSTMWLNSTATMFLYERVDGKPNWKCIDSFRVNLGRNGLAWDNNTVIPKYGSARVKHEGDGCSPAGIFTLGDVFGYNDISDINMEYIKVTGENICVDDITSGYYNKLLKTDTVAEDERDWNSFEFMKRNDDLYKYGIWLNYNTCPVYQSMGSCIFLHIQRADNSPTSGCTSMPEEKLLRVIHWLDKSKHPVLLQLAEDKL